MTIIDGVGNEVTQFFFIIFCALIALLAWWSTGQRQNRFRTAVILERNVRNVYRVIPQNPNGQNQTMLIIQRYLPENNVAHQPESDTSDVSIIEHDSPMLAGTTSDDLFAHSTSIDSDVTEEIIEEEVDCEKEGSSNPNENVSVESSSTQSMEMNNIVDAMDSEASVLRNRRLAFFTSRSDGQPDSTAIIQPVSFETEDAGQTENKIDSSKEPEKLNPQADVNDTKPEDADDENNIRIRLKYLNDDIKSVEGKLKEPLGDFKRRHFKGELSARKLVRLIFNGQVLKPEAATLESCGLFDNCVVHCLVHQPNTREQMAQMQQQLNPTPPVSSLNINTNVENPRNVSSSQMDFGSQEERDWDLSHLLFTLLASLLSVAWYIHIRFSSFFGVAASMAMLGLTVIYIVAVICVYFPEFPTTHSFRTVTANNSNQTTETATVN